MTGTLLVAAILAIPVIALLVWSAAIFLKHEGIAECFWLIGSVFLLVVILVHFFEALHFLPFLGWGSPKNSGPLSRSHEHDFRFWFSDGWLPAFAQEQKWSPMSASLLY